MRKPGAGEPHAGFERRTEASPSIGRLLRPDAGKTANHTKRKNKRTERARTVESACGLNLQEGETVLVREGIFS